MDAAIIRAKVHYVETDTWSMPFVYGGQMQAFQEQGWDDLAANLKSTSIPIIVGVTTLALVIVVVTVLLRKRQTNRLSFDSEKAENCNRRNGLSNNHHHSLANSDEETQDLNTYVA